MEETPVKCDECGSRNLSLDDVRGERVCVDCGLVIESDIVDLSAEWNQYEGKADKSRVGSPLNMMLHDKGLATDIDWQNRDYSGKAIANATRTQLHRMRKWQKRSRVSNSRERNLQQAMQDMSTMGSILGLPKSIMDDASLLYRRCLDANIIRGRSIPGVAAACIFIACELAHVPRPIQDVSSSLRMGKKELGRTIRNVKKSLRVRTGPKSANLYFDQFCSKLGLAPTVITECEEMYQKVVAYEMDSGRGPTGLAAAIIYIASIVCGQRRTQREIADIAGVTEVTIRNRYKELTSAFDIDLEAYE